MFLEVARHAMNSSNDVHLAEHGVTIHAERAVPPMEHFYRLLEAHDWHYMMSDDHRVYTNGIEVEKELKRIAKALGDSGLQLLEDFKQHMFTGKPWGNERKPKPVLEV
jgi:hypothetical protein